MNQRNEELGAIVREARKAAGMTQADLAKKVGVSDRTIGAFENGVRMLHAGNLRAVFRVLELDPDHPGGHDGDSIRARMPAEVRVLLDIMGGWLSALSEPDRERHIQRLTAYIFGPDGQGQ